MANGSDFHCRKHETVLWHTSYGLRHTCSVVRA